MREPPFTPTSFTKSLLWACRPKARGQTEWRRLLNFSDLFTCSSPAPSCQFDPPNPYVAGGEKPEKSACKQSGKEHPRKHSLVDIQNDLTPRTKTSLLIHANISLWYPNVQLDTVCIYEISSETEVSWVFEDPPNIQVARRWLCLKTSMPTWGAPMLGNPYYFGHVYIYIYYYILYYILYHILYIIY